MRRHLELLAVLPLLAAVAACTPDTSPSPVKIAPGEFHLIAFDSCDQALAELRAAAKEVVTPWGLNNFAYPDVMAAGGDMAEAAPRAVPPTTTTDKATYSGTNTHEAGVDEPDLVKTDGRRIITVGGGMLSVVDAATRRLTGSVRLTPDNFPTSGDLLLAGDHALVLLDPPYAFWADPAADVRPGVVGPMPTDYRPTLLLVDIAGTPRVLSSARVDGGIVDARQVGATARVVIRSSPRIDFPATREPEASEEARLAANKAVIDAAPIEAWLPRLELTTDGATTTAPVDCESVNRPAVYTGTNLLTVLTFDLGAKALTDGAPVTVVADGDTVYSNGTSLYVASNTYGFTFGADMAMAPQRTEIYKFDTPAGRRPAFVAGGAVPGSLLNQYSMSEWDGVLRVATTVDQNQSSGVYTLALDGASLKQVGSVEGLGKGERIYAVRFAGPIGYVVTFRQTDPLYTVDLSNPRNLIVKGELKIPGYSAYLHPVGDDRLIGVGQDANDEGRVQGTQISLFDVGNLADPRRIAQFKLTDAYSEAEFDPHAFLYWPATGLLVVPVSTYNQSGALVLKVGATSLDEVGFVNHPDYYGIRRSLLIGDDLWTVSDGGLQVNDAATLARIAWIGLAW